MAKVIKKLNPKMAYVDSCDVDYKRFGKEISSLTYNSKIISRHHADSRFIVVAAASIIAKVSRDKSIHRLKKNFDLGSGYPSDKNTVKCVSNIRNNGLIDIQGGSMIGTPGTAAKIFATLAKAGINVMMISQNPSESSITIVVKNSDLNKAVSVLEMDLLGKIIKKLEVTTGVSIIALIGSGMRGTIGVASKVFAAIEKNKVNVSMITQGSSELNLALVVKNSDTNTAVRAIHNAFTLDKIN